MEGVIQLWKATPSVNDPSNNRSQLVLTRRPGQSIVIETLDGQIRVTQLTRWRIAIEAPATVVVRRTNDDDAPSA